MSYYIEKRTGKTGKVSYRVKVRIMQFGKIVHSETETFGDHREAVAFGARRDKELEKKLADPEAFKEAVQPAPPVVEVLSPTIGEMLERYKAECAPERIDRKTGEPVFEHSDTIRWQIERLKRTTLAKLFADQLKAGDVIEYAKARRKVDKVGASTVKDELVRLLVAVESTLRFWPHLGANVATEIRIAMKDARKHRVIRSSKHRERVITETELAALIEHFDGKMGKPARGVARSIPMADIVRFAYHSARRQDEITQLRWADCNPATLGGIVPFMKDRGGMREQVPFQFTPEAWEIAMRQPRVSDRIFPTSADSVCYYFWEAHVALDLDVRFHDLRHTAITNLFKKGYSIPEVAMFSCHKSWESLKRYTNLKPGDFELR